MELEKNKTSRAEQIILDYTASSNWEQIKYMEWTTAEMMDVFDKHLPTLFKVATEDSPEVLVEPINPNTLEPQHDLTPEIVAKMWKYLDTYNKAPLISQDRLKLNQARIKIKSLGQELGHLYAENASLTCSNQEANKQLKETKKSHAFDIKQQKQLINRLSKRLKAYEAYYD